ncbi:MAG: hypothetical protein O3A10_06305 [Chloroflexi bacterium]|nr:hypothetical protein [Chloroflexota bacterium]MDA1145600.1 hypothetical protein [Chloroflexota bacterium]
MSNESPITISAFDERWWAGMLARRRIAHQLEEGESGDCSYPDCAWHGVTPGEANAPSPASPP